MFGKRLILIFIFVFGICSCDTYVNIVNRSGSLENDYVEEPISEYSQKYSNALYTSNSFLEYIKAKDYEHIYDNYIDDIFKKNTNFEQFKNIFVQVDSNFGMLKRYKEMQWGFWPKNEGGRDILISSKIVEYEKSTLKFYFIFENDKQYRKLIGINIIERLGVAKIGTL